MATNVFDPQTGQIYDVDPTGARTLIPALTVGGGQLNVAPNGLVYFQNYTGPLRPGFRVSSYGETEFIDQDNGRAIVWTPTPEDTLNQPANPSGKSEYNVRLQSGQWVSQHTVRGVASVMTQTQGARSVAIEDGFIHPIGTQMLVHTTWEGKEELKATFERFLTNDEVVQRFGAEYRLALPEEMTRNGAIRALLETHRDELTKMLADGELQIPGNPDADAYEAAAWLVDSGSTTLNPGTQRVVKL